MWTKIRPNVLLISIISAAITFVALLMGERDIALLGVGSLLGLASGLATDPPPPSVPANVFTATFEKVVDVFTDARRK